MFLLNLMTNYSIKETRVSNDGTGMTSNFRPEIGALLGDGASDGGASHLSLGVNDNTCIVFEI